MYGAGACNIVGVLTIVLLAIPFYAVVGVYVMHVNLLSGSAVWLGS